MVDIVGAIVAIIVAIIMMISGLLNPTAQSIPQPDTDMAANQNFDDLAFTGSGADGTPDPCAHVRQVLSENTSYGRLAAQLIKIENPETMVRVSDIEGSHPYQELDIGRRGAHVGQFKLQLSEIQFLTECMPIFPRDTQTFVIYAGSGPGHSRQNLADMFPMMKFVLIDPQEHVIRGCSGCGRDVGPRSKLYFRSAKPDKSAIQGEMIDFATTNGIITCAKRDAPGDDENDPLLLSPDAIADCILRNPRYTFYMIEDYFTDALARAFVRLGTGAFSSVFISDIRTNFKNPSARPRGQFAFASPDADDSPSDLDIIINNIWQHNWVSIMRPLQCMLKFRTTFNNPRDIAYVRAHAHEHARDIDAYNAQHGIDMLAEYEQRRYMFMPHIRINLQVFAGPSSTETRLIAGRDEYSRIVAYNPTEHEDALFYYNMMREYCFFRKNLPLVDERIGLDCCVDCNLALHIMREYLNARAKYHIEARNVPLKPEEIIAGSLMRMGRTLITPTHGHVVAPYRDLRDATEKIVNASRLYYKSKYAHASQYVKSHAPREAPAEPASPARPLQILRPSQTAPASPRRW